jgi:leucyl/phenylalanyl-tRNA---protein transferase
VSAYADGLFPMPIGRKRLGWWSPEPRGVLPLDGLVISRSLRRSVRRYRTCVDTAFEQVIDRCASIPRPHGWITHDMVDAYVDLHRLGLAHSVETWEGSTLVGGLYGVSLGGLFAGESMFHERDDASKVALVRLVDELRTGDGTLLDVQWTTPHLRSLGAVDLPRPEYLERLAVALDADPPAVFSDGRGSPPR